MNQAWVKRYANGQNPVNMQVRMTFSASEPYREIVGVIGNVAEDNLAAAPPPVMYFPVDQSSGYTAYLSYVVRTSQEPAAFFHAVRAVLGQPRSTAGVDSAADHGPAHRPFTGGFLAPLSLLPDRQLRHPGASAGHRRPVLAWSPTRTTAHARDRHPHGPGCAAPRHPAPDAAPGRLLRGGRRCHRPGRDPGTDADHGQPVLRHHRRRLGSCLPGWLFC